MLYLITIQDKIILITLLFSDVIKIIRWTIILAPLNWAAYINTRQTTENACSRRNANNNTDDICAFVDDKDVIKRCWRWSAEYKVF